MGNININGKSIEIRGDIAGRDIIKKSSYGIEENIIKKIDELFEIIAKSDTEKTLQMAGKIENDFKDNFDDSFQSEVKKIARRKMIEGNLNANKALPFLKSISTSAAGSGIITIITECLRMLV